MPTPAPLVVMMHGGFGSGEQAERAYGHEWPSFATQTLWQFFVAHPR